MYRISTKGKIIGLLHILTVLSKVCLNQLFVVFFNLIPWVFERIERLKRNNRDVFEPKIFEENEGKYLNYDGPGISN